MDEPIAHLVFGRGGNAEGHTGIGWSPAEPGFRWMIDAVSEFWLSAPASGSCILTLDLHPHVRPPLLATQRVVIFVGETEVYRAELSVRTTCDIPIPSEALPEAEQILIKIQHPDAISPRDLSGADDTRRLAFSIREARLYPGKSQAEHEAVPPEIISAPAVIGEPSRFSTVFVGNCQMGALCSLYRRLVPPDGDHDVTYIASYNSATEDDRRTIATADVLVQQVLNFVPRIGDLATRAKVHLVPHASAAFLWPFAGMPHPLNRPEPTIEQTGPYNAELGDSFLNRMIADRISPANAVADYLAAESLAVRRAERMMELHLQNQRERDAACDIDVAGRIEDQLTTVRLFRSQNHPEPVMTGWLAAEVFARMGEDPAAIARLVASQPDVLPATEVPIHPAVVRHFSLTYAPPNRRYRYFNEGGFTFTEYADRYMRFEWNALLAEGMHLLWQKKTALAIPKLEMALPTAPRSAIGRMALAEALVPMGRLTDAIEYACQAVVIEPENESFRRRLWQLFDKFRVQMNVAATPDPITNTSLP